MKHIVCLAFLYLSAAAGCAQERAVPSPQASLEPLSWLIGTWDRTNVREGETAHEQWKSSGTELLGRGVTIVGSDTVFVENLVLRLNETRVEYVAHTPGNEEPVVFTVTALTDTSFVSENPEHDFPKMIAYYRSGNSMTAVISGNGRQIGFMFDRREE